MIARATGQPDDKSEVCDFGTSGRGPLDFRSYGEDICVGCRRLSLGVASDRAQSHVPNDHSQRRHSVVYHVR